MIPTSSRIACRIGSVLVTAVLVALAAGCATTTAAEDSQRAAERARTVVASPVRTDADRKLDAARHPVEFLAFTQVGPGMRVLDVSAGAGYTSQLLALAVGPEGRLWAQAPQPGATLRQRLADRPQDNFVIAARPFEDPVPDGVSGLDLVTIVLNYHDISYLPVDRAKMNRRLFEALKPGGRIVIVDHAARPGSGTADGRTLHRIDEAVVRSELAQAGFVLDAEGAFLRNPADPRDATSNGSPIPTDKFALRFVRPR